MVWYFYQSQNKLQKKKGKIKQREKGKIRSSPLTWATRPNLPLQPAQPSLPLGVFLPTPRSCSVECMQHSTDAADESGHAAASPRLLIASGGFAQQAASISPSSHRLSPPLLVDFFNDRKPPERAAVADVATAP